jgi:GntR family transcriptional regulator
MLVPIQINFRSDTPIYIQIMEQIRQLVGSGQLQAGDQLPTVRQLATELRINFNTVARAYRLLDEAGLISTQHGRGTYIWETVPEDVQARLRQESLLGIVQRFLAQASRLGYSPEEIFHVVEAQLSAWKEGSPPPDNAAED